MSTLRASFRLLRSLAPFVVLGCLYLPLPADEVPKDKPLTAAQSERLKERDRLVQQARKLQDSRDIKKALGILSQVLDVEREVFGDTHRELAGTLEQMAQLHLQLEEFAKARALYGQQLKMLRQLAGAADGLEVKRVTLKLADVDRIAKLGAAPRRRYFEAIALDRTVRRYFDEGKPRQALKPAEDSLKICREVLGEDHYDTGIAYGNLGGILAALGETDKAEQYFDKAIACARKNLGRGSDLEGNMLNSLGYLRLNQGRNAEARPFFEEALEITRTIRGDAHGSTAAVRNNLGMVYQNLGDYKSAQRYYDDALTTYTKVLGDEHRLTVLGLINLGLIRQLQGDYAGARPYLEKALATAQKVDNPSLTAMGLSSLAGLLRTQGDLAQARPLYVRALFISRKTLGDTHPTTVTILNNLALLLEQEGVAASDPGERQKRFAEALDHMKAVLAANEKNGRTDHADHAMALNNLGFLLLRQGNDADARPYLEQSLAVFKKALGEKHPSTRLPLCNLAYLLMQQGKLAEARKNFEQALALCRETLGEDHPDTAESAQVLGGLLLAQGKYGEARPYLEQVLRVQLKVAEDVLGTVSEAEAMAYVESSQTARHGLLSVLRALPDVSPETAYEAVWTTRGLAARALASRHNWAGADLKARAVWEQLQSVRAQLVKLTMREVNRAQVQWRHHELSKLNADKERLERELARLSAPFRARQRANRASLAEVAACLPVRGALVDLVECVVLEPARTGNGDLRGVRHYEAFILRPARKPPGYSVSWVHLGPAATIDRSVAVWRKLLTGKPKPTAAESVSLPELRLRRLVWEPIQAKLAGCATVIMMPDGALTGVPWVALPGDRPGSYLVEAYAFGVALYPQQLYEFVSKRPPVGNRVLSVGGVYYLSHWTELNPDDPADRKKMQDTGLYKGIGLGYLPGSLPEAESIGDLAREAGYEPTLLTKVDATVGAVKKALPLSRFVHLATHGVYYDPKFAPRVETDEKMSIDRYYMTGRRSTVAARNPLTLCEIHLANSLATYTDAHGVRLRGGVLVAENVAGMDLSNTELVTLSACQTALGEMASGEGVFGFQRAFNLAGARSVVGSLWSVPDEATSVLLQRFYANLWGAKMSRAEALRQAQLSVMRRWKHPYAWAAWTLSGDPGGLLRPGEPRPEFADPVTPKVDPVKPETPPVKPAPAKPEPSPAKPAPAKLETPPKSALPEASAPAQPEPVKDPTPVVATEQIPAEAPNAGAGPWAAVAVGGTTGIVIIVGWLGIQSLARRRRG